MNLLWIEFVMHYIMATFAFFEVLCSITISSYFTILMEEVQIICYF
jgi:hypothetical protein